MKASDLIAIFSMMYDQKWSYIWGKAEKGCVDCSGAFVYAFKQYGKSIAHGSNTIARKYIVKMLPISECKPGYAVFKLRKDGQEPDRYKADGLGNFYHIGLCGYDGRVLNAQGVNAGFTNTDLSKWHSCAMLKGVDYDEKENEAMTAVLIDGISSLNMRKNPSTESALVERIPKGSTITVTDDNSVEGWTKISYKGYSGWVMSKYINIGTDAKTSLEDRVKDLEIQLDDLRKQVIQLDDLRKLLIREGVIPDDN